MTLLVTNKERISNTVIAYAVASKFYAVIRNVETKAMSRGGLIVPQSCLTNDTVAGWQHDRQHGRDWISKRSAWRWQLILQFGQEALLEEFEETWAHAPLRLAATTELPSVMIQPTDAIYTHPPAQQPSSGTRVLYTFEAVVWRP